MRKGEKPSLSLRLKLTAVVVLLAVVPLGLVGYAIIDIKTDALRDANRLLLMSVTRDLAGTIENTFEDTEDRLLAVGQAIARAEQDPDTRIAIANALIAGAETIEVVTVYDGEGKEVAVLGEKKELELPTTLQPELRELAGTQGVAIERPKLVGGTPRALIAVPVEGEGARWYAATLVNLEPIQDRAAELAGESFSDDLSSVIVIDRFFRALAHPNRELSDTLSPMHEHGLLRDFEGGRLPQNLEVFQVGVDSEGRDMVAVLVSIKSLGWGIIAQLPEDRAFKSVAEMRRLVLWVLALVGLLAAGAAIFLAHRMTEPIRKLVHFAKNLANRRFDARVTIHTRDELSVLGQALSTAAMELEESEREIKQQVEIRSNLGRYLPGQLVERIVAREQNLELGGERREITVLFADVAGFTPLAESQAAEDVVTILNELFTILTEIVFRHDGTVDKFVGDCVMAFWGAPDPQADHASRAVRAAEDMLRFLELGNKSWEEKYGVSIRLAIGINTGDAVVGNFGSETRMEYTAVGAAVNLAAHLEAIARPQQIVVTAATKAAAGDDFEYLDLGERELPGHADATELWEVRV